MKKIRILYLIILILLLILFFYNQNKSIVISDYIYESSKISNSFNNYKVLQLSDLHNNEFAHNNKKLVKIINNINPDAIFITGDLIDKDETNLKVIENLLMQIKYDIYYVTGNHEYSSGLYSTLKKILNKYNVTILENEYITLKKGDKNIELYGINDPSLVAKNLKLSDGQIIKNEIKSIISESKNLKILLTHRPEHFKEYVEFNFDLVFSGHAHGGQIILPFIGSLYAPHQGLFPKYTDKYYNKKNTTMYVSRGLGNNIIIPRIFNRPELIEVTFKKF